MVAQLNRIKRISFDFLAQSECIIMQKENAAVLIFVYFCPQYASYFYMNYVDIKEYYMYIDMQGDNLYILSRIST